MMNETLKNLETRRSIRKYKETQIKEEELNAILRAGTYAPTGKNKQSPVMIVAQEKELVKRLSKMNAMIMGTEGDPFYGAPTAVIVVADKTNYNYVKDGSLVMGNLMNAAHAVGVGSCWINRAKEMLETEEGKKLLKHWGLDENYEGIGICILGYADGIYPVASPRKKDYIIRA
ncbi:oxygen-insensitive NAD(P)H nitroreductase [Lachnospiraceae bacterium KM106-2]|nr:oxygen-insensitive NAD(P)H nitroreductase [Lachnospiraceae bacterium KM106-2]